MSFVLFVLGLIAVAAGVATIGFGIPINELHKIMSEAHG